MKNDERGRELDGHVVNERGKALRSSEEERETRFSVNKH